MGCEAFRLGRRCCGLDIVSEQAVLVRYLYIHNLLPLFCATVLKALNPSHITLPLSKCEW